EVPAAEAPDLAPLGRAIVHVPPGAHVYRVESVGGEAFVVALAARAVIHLEDGLTGAKSESHLLDRARRACGAGAPGICAMALALAGDDRGAAWGDALRAAPDVVAVAEDLARGGPRDPTAEIEALASRG